MPSPARMKVSGLQAPVSPARTDGRLKIPLPITPLMIAAVRSQRPMARTRPGGAGARGHFDGRGNFCAQGTRRRGTCRRSSRVFSLGQPPVGVELVLGARDVDLRLEHRVGLGEQRSVWRSASCMRMVPPIPWLAPRIAAGLPFSGDSPGGRDAQSMAFFRTPGTPGRLGAHEQQLRRRASPP